MHVSQVVHEHLRRFASETQAQNEVDGSLLAAPTLTDLPPDLLARVAHALLPSRLEDDTAWRAVCAFGGACTALHAALGQALGERYSALSGLAPRSERAGSCWLEFVASIRNPAGRGSWHQIAPLRAKRPAARCVEPMLDAPRLSGGTLCAIGGSRLVLFGGRSSESGATLAKTQIVTVTWVAGRGLARWDELRFAPDAPLPGARCYHSAVRWTAAERDACARMLVFGGAGESADGSSECAEGIYGDTWCLLVRPDLPNAAWERIAPESAHTPAPRSSHVCSTWADGGGVAVLHGGLGSGGVMADVWMLAAQGGWQRLETRGPAAARAHHIGAVVRDTLLLFSGQDERLLTVSTLSSLHLRTATWSAAAPLPPQGPPARIDASGGVLSLGAGCGHELGLIVFGGVGGAFEFEPPTPWLLRTPAQEEPVALVDVIPAAQPSRPAQPCSRACAAFAVDGLHAYAFGGFDGQHDLDELWCLSLVPHAFSQIGEAERLATVSGWRGAAAAPASADDARVTTDAARAGSPKASYDAIGATEFRLRRAAQVKELQSLRGANGQSYMPVHLRVWDAGAACDGLRVMSTE